jgi:hypothetical protein
MGAARVEPAKSSLVGTTRRIAATLSEDAAPTELG